MRGNGDGECEEHLGILRFLSLGFGFLISRFLRKQGFCFGVTVNTVEQDEMDSCHQIFFQGFGFYDIIYGFIITFILVLIPIVNFMT